MEEQIWSVRSNRGKIELNRHRVSKLRAYFVYKSGVVVISILQVSRDCTIALGLLKKEEAIYKEEEEG